MYAIRSYYESLATPHGVARFLDAVTKLSFNVSALALAAMLSLVVNEVAMRYFFNAPTTWSVITSYSIHYTKLYECFFKICLIM